MAQQPLPEWATTVGTTVYSVESGSRSQTVRKGTVSRATSSSTWVKGLYGHLPEKELRFGRKGWSGRIEEIGGSDFYRKTLISEAEGLQMEARETARRAHDDIKGKAARTIQQASYSLNPTTAQEAIDALKEYLTDIGSNYAEGN